MMDPITTKEIFAANGCTFSNEQLTKLDEYSKLLLGWNANVNLISRKDQEGVWPNHILHSISLLFEIGFPTSVQIADIGSGGGLPGIPLAIAMPHAEFVLIESIRKKCMALEDMIRRLGLPNAKVANARAEEVSGTNALGHSFDLVLARAVAPLGQLIEWSGPLVRKAQKQELRIRKAGAGPDSVRLPVLLAMKGGNLESEIVEAKQGSHFRSLHKVPILFDGIQRAALVDKCIVVVAL